MSEYNFSIDFCNDSQRATHCNEGTGSYKCQIH